MKILAIAIILAQIVGTWKTDMSLAGINGSMRQQVSVRGSRLYVQTTGTGKLMQPKDNYTESMPLADIACVTTGKSDIWIYGATKTSTIETVRSGKTSRHASMWLSTDNASQRGKMLEALESAVPRIRAKLNACKNEVDLYRLHFVPPSGTRRIASFDSGTDSMLPSHYEITASATRLYVHQKAMNGNTTLFDYVDEVPFAEISCIYQMTDGKGLRIDGAFDTSVLRRSSDGAVVASGDTLLDTDDRMQTQDVLDQLERASPVIEKKVDACK